MGRVPGTRVLKVMAAFLRIVSVAFFKWVSDRSNDSRWAARDRFNVVRHADWVYSSRFILF